MIEKTVKEIRAALDNRLYFIALMSALTLPDICGKAEYPNEKSTGNRYRKWLNQYVNSREFGKYEYPAIEGLEAEIIYKLRCNLLHQGTPNVEESFADIDYFELVKVDPRSCHQFQYSIGNKLEKIDGVEQVTAKIISINIASLCHLLCDSAELYYINNKEKFGFIRYNLVDIDYHTRNIFKLNFNKFDE